MLRRHNLCILLAIFILCSSCITKSLASKNTVSLIRANSAFPLYKLDPILKRIALEQKLRLAPSIALPMVASPRDDHFISSIIKVSGNPENIESTGARIRSVMGNIVTADVPAHSLDRLIQYPNVIYIQASRQMQPSLLDASVSDTGADLVWRSMSGYTGKDVIAGIIDSGIDWRRSDFSDENGASRILYIWDQTIRASNHAPIAYGYGVEWTKEHIDSGQCQQTDPSGHGTHVASIIAGNGGYMHEFVGMAPEANIIMVKTSYRDADILDAVNYILDKASELGRPVAINMSLGGGWGPHDGTSLMEQALNSVLVAPGVAIAAAAGNDGNMPVHMGSPSLPRSFNGNYPWTAVSPFLGEEYTAVEIWYDSPEPLLVRFLVPENDRGDLADLGMGWVSEGEYGIFTVPSGPLAGAEVIIDVQKAGSELMGPDSRGTYIHISNNGDPTIPIDEYIYAIEYNGVGIELDAYVVKGGYFTKNLDSSVSFPSRSYLLAGDGNKTISSPSSAASVICVASYVTKSEWIDSENRVRDENLRPGNISLFSSRGPLLNGMQKPDIAAPGEMIVAALSAEGWGGTSRINQDRGYIAYRGTSMSCPHVTGALALMFEQRPDLTASEAKYMLTSTAVDSGLSGWDESWGHGKLNILTAMEIPSMPDELRAIAGEGSANLLWAQNPESDIEGYRIYAVLDGKCWMLDTANWLSDIGAWSTDARCWMLDNGRWIPETDCWMLTSIIQYRTSRIEYRLSNIENDVPISFSVSAYNSIGNEGPKSREIVVTPNSTGADINPPVAPENLKLSPLDGALDLKWSQSPEHDLSAYKIYYGKSSHNYDEVLRIGKVTEYRLNNLANGERIYVAIAAVDSSGNESEKSSELSAVPQLLHFPSLDYQIGWPVTMSHDLYSSPALYDIDDDGKLEISISSRDGEVYLLHHDGQIMPGWPISIGLPSVSSTAMGDVDGDGRVEIVVGAGEEVFMWHEDGTPAQGWPQSTDGKILASPALGDIDGDGRMEVIIGSYDGNIYAYNSDGSAVSGWPVNTSAPVHSSAAIGDMNGDSRMEIVVGSGDGNLYVFNDDGTIANGWPLYLIWAVNLSPALGDIDGDGNMEIVIANQHGRVYALRYNGDHLNGWPVGLQNDVISSPVLGDLDNDKDLEVVISTENGLVYVLKGDGETLDGYPASVDGEVNSAPVIGDIDGDGSIDIVVATDTGLGYTGLIYAFNSSGEILETTLWPISVEGNISNSSPALGDLDGDGDIELMVGSCRQYDNPHGSLYAWDLSGFAIEGAIRWGGFRNGPHHTGVVEDMLPPSFIIGISLSDDFWEAISQRRPSVELVPPQNAPSKNFLNLYVTASERLSSDPYLTLEVILRDAKGEKISRSIPLIRSSTASNIFTASFAAEWDGLYTFTVSGSDPKGNIGFSSKTISISFPGQDSELLLATPASSALLPNYPNPFNPGTWIPYELSGAAAVTITIYDVNGRIVRKLEIGNRMPGYYVDKSKAAYWDGRNESGEEVSSGVYFYRLKAGESYIATRKMIIAR